MTKMESLEVTNTQGDIKCPFLTEKDITVIIPVYNSEKTILTALDSVYNQIARPKTTIIINDGSNDNTEAKCIEWKQNHSDIDFELVSISNEGASNARNVGIKRTTTKLIAFLDSDDSWEPDKIQKQLAVFNKSSESACNLVCSGSNLRPTDDKIYTISKKQLLLRNLIVTSSVLVKTEIIKKYLFNTRLRRSEDYNLWLKIASNDKGIFLINSSLTNYSVDVSPNKLSNNLKKFELDELKNFKLLFKEHYISFFEYSVSSCFSLIKYIRRGIIK